MKLHFNQSCFPGLPLERFLAVAAEAGADGVDLAPLGRSESVRAIGAAVRDAGLPVGAVHALMDWALPDEPDPLPALDALLEVAVAAGASLIVCVAPLRMGGFPPDLDIAAAASERLALLAAQTRAAGVRLALEQVGRSSSRPGATSGIRRLDAALAIAERSGEDATLVVDSYNLATAGESFGALRVVPAARLGTAHLADADQARGVRVPPGDGELDLAHFVQTLAGAGYAGPLSLEIFPPTPWPDPAAFALRMVDEMRRLLRNVPRD